ncbi:MAG: hypothetical protein AAB392_00935 [Patescibacteria group bacterium]
MRNFVTKISMPFARFSLFIIYAGFGLLKIIGESPANEIVKALFEKTIASRLTFLSFDQFFLAFGIFEILIGILFLIKFDRTAFLLLIVHLCTTALPLFMIGELVWAKNWIPTLEGQYIIKNLALLSLGFFVYSRD